MRISTNTFFEHSVRGITDLQSSLGKVQTQIASGKKLTSPSDDPIAAAQVIEINQSIAMNDQYARNRLQLKNSLSHTDTVMNDVQDVLLNIHETTIAASNGVASVHDKAAYASTLQGYYDQLLKLANTTDSYGNYIFAGSNNGQQAFVRETVVQPKINPQTGTPVLDASGQVVTESVYTGRVIYRGSQDDMIVNVDHGSSMASTVNGATLIVTENNQNIFTKLQAAIEALNNPSTSNTDPSLTELVNSFSSALTQLGTVQSEVANRLKTIDQLDTLGSSRSLQLNQELSSLQDLDFNKAIAEFSRQQMVLQAAQQTFAQVSKMSLFDYIKN